MNFSTIHSALEYTVVVAAFLVLLWDAVRVSRLLRGGAGLDGVVDASWWADNSFFSGFGAAALGWFPGIWLFTDKAIDGAEMVVCCGPLAICAAAAFFHLPRKVEARFIRLMCVAATATAGVILGAGR